MSDTPYFKVLPKSGKMKEIPSMEVLCEILKEKFEGQEQKIEYLTKEKEELLNEKWKDETLKEYKEKYEKMQADYFRGFPISEEEDQKLSEWETQHVKEKHNGIFSIGVSGGRFRYIFNPTGIGIIGIIKCNCGDSFCFRELD